MWRGCGLQGRLIHPRWRRGSGPAAWGIAVIRWRAAERGKQKHNERNRSQEIHGQCRGGAGRGPAGGGMQGSSEERGALLRPAGAAWSDWSWEPRAGVDADIFALA